jgi:hypothetical protein
LSLGLWYSRGLNYQFVILSIEGVGDLDMGGSELVEVWGLGFGLVVIVGVVGEMKRTARWLEAAR